jgi:hypothetical protein
VASREERQRRAQEGANSRGAGGGPPDSPRDFGLRGSRDSGPIPVRIVEAQQQFFDNLKAAINGGGSDGRSNDTQAIMDSSRAVSEAARQIADEVKNLATMMRDTQAQSAQQGQSMINFVRQMQAYNQVQMSQLMNAIQNGMMGGGGGAPGHGGGGHQSFPGYNPQSGQFTSYGGIQSRMRVGAANWLNRTLGTPGVGQHANAAAQQQAANYSRIAGGLAHSGIMGGLRRAPGIGMGIAAVEGVNNGMEWLTNQRAANSRYQSIYAGDNVSVGGIFSGMGAMFGGSTDDRSGIANRMAETGFVLGNRFRPGGMTEEQSRAAFQGVSELGFVGNRRDENLQFVQRAYKNLGMDPGETMQYNQLQSQYGQNNLDSLYQSLEKVSKAAQRTSQSAESLRKSFVGNYQTALAGGAGASATGLAGAMTMMTANNRDLAGVSYGAGVLTNPVLQYAGAGMIGMTPGQVQGQAAQGNPFPQLASQQALTSNMLNQSTSPAVKQKLKDLIAGKGGREKVQGSGGAQYDIATDLIQHPEWNTEAVRMAMMQAGVSGIDQSSSPEQVAEAYINFTSGNDFTKQAGSLQDQYSVKMLGKGNESQTFQDFKKGLSDRQTKESASASWFGSTTTELLNGIGIDTRSDEQTAIDQGNATADAYKDLQKNRGDSGLSDPGIEAAISRFGSDPNMKIRVQSKDGDKVVSLADAIKYYPDQLTKGSASIASTDSSLNGKRISDVTGVKDVNVGPMEDSSKTQNFGDSADQWSKDNPVEGTKEEDSGNGSGKVTIELSPAVARYFSVTGTGVNIDSAAAAGVPPKPGG